MLATPFLDLSAIGFPGAASRACWASPSTRPTRRTASSTSATRTATGTSVIREYQRLGVEPGPRRRRRAAGRSCASAQPYANHNGGNIAFGPDGDLYIGFGDGGSARRSGQPRAEPRNVLLGKLLRIDVNRRTGTLAATASRRTNPFVGRSGLDQIWAYGLRNPWRWSFDRATGDLWIGDVGQDAWEEVDRALAVHGRNAGRASTSAGG